MLANKLKKYVGNILCKEIKEGKAEPSLLIIC